MSTRNPGLPAHVTDSLLFDSSPYLSCDECFERLDTYVEAMIADPGYLDTQMAIHLGACGVCAEEAEALTELVRGAQD